MTNVNKEQLVTAVHNLYVYGEEASQYTTAVAMDKRITAIYDSETLKEIMAFIDSSATEEDFHRIAEENSIKQYFVNLEIIANMMKEQKESNVEGDNA